MFGKKNRQRVPAKAKKREPNPVTTFLQSTSSQPRANGAAIAATLAWAKTQRGRGISVSALYDKYNELQSLSLEEVR